IIDGTPLLDIKPYVPEFDREVDVRVGWLTGKSCRVKDTFSDDRFKK
ncbi:MAG: tRNA (N6-threonylcarbamoyladenosine(37)-N6)-methyltransferase TrmO, partial [Candidatus Zixiibacteriota bacterium]